MIIKKIFKTTSSLILVSQLLTPISFGNENVCFAGVEAEDGGTSENSQAESFTKEQSKVDEVKRSEKSESSKNEKSKRGYFDEKLFDQAWYLGTIISGLIAFYFYSERQQRPVGFIHGNVPVYSNVDL